MFATKTEVLSMARAMAAHAGARQGLIARNIAHADTPGYRPVDLVPFSEVWRQSGLALRATRPGHLDQGALRPVQTVAAHPHQSPNGNSVSLEQQMVRAAEVRRDHDLALAIQRSLSGVVRTALGRR